MVLNDPFQAEDFKKCADFHGHICPGLSIGYRASQRAMEWLRENRAEDEEIVAIIETNACGADAVQVLTGCTFGKGNLIFKDHGKQVLTLLSRKSGDGVRVALKADALELNEEHRQLMVRIQKGDATDIEKKRFQELHLMRSRNIMENTEEALFDVREIHENLPPRAQIEPSISCDRCGEPTMASKLSAKDGMQLCGGCLEG
jgi:formylmethanofuran dehydrogenase subunit E